jgi:EpsI family protein
MKRLIIIIVLTLVTSFAAFTVREAEPLKNERLFQFPMKIGGWSGEEIKMQDWVFASLQTKYAILRDYRSKEGHVVNLAITWYDDKEVAFHPPEECLGGVGNKVRELTTERIAIDDSKEYRLGRILAERSGTRFLVYYFFSSDGYVTPDIADLRKRVLLRRIGFNRTSAGFVRFMIPIRDNEARTKALLLDFMKAVFPATLEFTHTGNISRS